ncbi:MAG TPA: hypothetical protein VKP66_19905 [Steroidobacteraceae bacterium]|nr:hypothetical protein [Steroidobacteraceae bacterium]
MTHGRYALALTGVLIVLAGCEGPDTGNELKKINGSVHVAAGAAPQAAATVNGDIHIDDSAAVTEATHHRSSGPRKGASDGSAT